MSAAKGRLPIEQLEATMLALVRARGPGATISAMDVARSIAGNDPDAWAPLMQPLRRIAVRLMKGGQVVILRKGRPVDPDDFRGVYRIALPPAGSGAGSNASV